MSIKGGYTPIIASTATTATTATKLVGQTDFANFTPSLTCGTPGDLAITYSTRVGKSRNNGNGTATVVYSIATSAFTWSTASGVVFLSGFPIAGGASLPHVEGSMLFQGITSASYTQFVPIIRSGSGVTEITILKCGTGQSASNLAIADIPSGGSVAIALTITYII